MRLRYERLCAVFRWRGPQASPQLVTYRYRPALNSLHTVTGQPSNRYIPLQACPQIDSLDVPNEKLQFPLHCAAFEAEPESVRLMLAAGASTTVVDRKGRTPAEDTRDEGIRQVTDW